MTFDVVRFQKKYKQMMEENSVLRQQIVEWAKAKIADTESAVLSAVTPLRNQIAELKLELATAHHRMRQFQEIRSQLEDCLGAARRESDARREIIADRDKRIQDLERQVNDALAKRPGEL